jgi:hypothetical protein
MDDYGKDQNAIAWPSPDEGTGTVRRSFCLLIEI